MTCSLLACLALAACEKDPAKEPETVKYAVTASAGENGKAAASVAEAEAGAEVTFTATPDEGFAFDKWTVEKGNVTVSNPAENPLKVVMPKEDISLKASFVALKFPHAIKVTSPENGTVTVEGDLKEALEGVTVTITAAPAEGFEFKGWTVEGVEIEDLAANPLTFVMPDAEVTVSAEFAALFNILDWVDEYFEGKRPDYGDEVDDYKENVKSFLQYHMDNSVTFTDPLSRETIHDNAWDSNADGILSLDEAAKVKMISVDDFLASLAFVHYFTGLEILACNENYSPFSGWGEELDLSYNERLRYIDLAEASLDCGFPFILGNKPELERLDLAYTWLPELDITECPKLAYLDIEGTDIEELDITGIEAASGWTFKFDGDWQIVILRADQEAAFAEAYPDMSYDVAE